MMEWTAKNVETLTRLWGEGKSAAAISEAIGQGCTRNGVLGKAHRIGLASRPSPIIRDGEPAKYSNKGRKLRTRFPAKAVREIDRRAEAPKLAPVRELSARLRKVGSCCWTDSERRPWVFCDQPAVTDRPYCLAHCERAYAGFGKGATAPDREPVQHQYGNAAKFR